MLDRTIPAYGNPRCRLDVTAKKDINKGDACNTFSIILENHWGTHVDAPAHFFRDAKTPTDYVPDSWFFNDPCVVKLRLKKGSIISINDIVAAVSKKSDILLLKTGFNRFRGTRTYSFDNPAVSPDVGRWLRRNRPNVRAIGFDFVSLGCCRNRNLARQAHREFLNPRGKGSPILIIEDMDLSCDLSGLKKVFAAPLLVKNIDSAPCTVFGIFDNKLK